MSMSVAISGFNLHIFGIFFAPIMTPHYSERLRRRPIYLISYSCACYSSSVPVAAQRAKPCWPVDSMFVSSAPCLVLIEGTFADIWSADSTHTYYSFSAAAANVGAGLGPIIQASLSRNKTSHEKAERAGEDAYVLAPRYCRFHRLFWIMKTKAYFVSPFDMQI